MTERVRGLLPGLRSRTRSSIRNRIFEASFGELRPGGADPTRDASPGAVDAAS